MSLLVLLSLLATPSTSALGHELAELPTCTNRVVASTVRRVGCTLGDARCWLTSGGMCIDWVERKVASAMQGQEVRLEAIEAARVRRGDVAVFAARAHYAYVERVVTDEAGMAVAVDLSEFNFGTCWIDRALLVTDQYREPNRRDGIELTLVDGGFLRPVPVPARKSGK